MIGIFLGNSPQIDALPPEFWEKISAPQFVSLGVNRICISAPVGKLNFAPTHHMILDWNEKIQKNCEAGLQKLAGRTVRMIGTAPGGENLPHDFKLRYEREFSGDENKIYYGESSLDAGLDFLLRRKCDPVYIYGVDMTDNSHCAITGEETESPEPLGENALRLRMAAVRSVRAAYPTAEIYCALLQSILVREKIFDFQELPF